MKEVSLTRRLIIIVFALFIAMLGASGFFTYKSAQKRVNKDYDAQLISEAHLLWMIASEEVEEPKGLEQIDLDFGAPSMSGQQRAILTQYTQWRAFRIWKDGRLAEQSDTSRVLRAPPAPPGFSNYKEGGDVWRAYAIHIPKKKLVIEAWEKRDNRDRLLRGILDELIEPMIIIMPLFAALIILSVRYGLKDLFVMAREIGARRPEDLSRLTLRKIPRELKPLKNAINSLLEKLESTMERERQFIDDAAHELKTPLTALKLQSQLIQSAPTEKDRDECVRTLQEGIDRTRRVFDQVLTLSRVSGARPSFQTCDVGDILKGLIAERAVIAADKNIDIGLEETSTLLVQSNADLVRILVGILIDNAIKYVPESGHITLSVLADRVEIADSGPGIPDGEKEKVFDRFYRVKNDPTPGSGLGLAIAKKCADILGVAIRLDNAPVPPGLVAKVLFPPAMPDADA